MSKRAVLRCDGSLEQGFRVTLEISEGNAPVFTEAIGGLPAADDRSQITPFALAFLAFYRSLSPS